jgi:hypothetical protein
MSFIIVIFAHTLVVSARFDSRASPSSNPQQVIEYEGVSLSRIATARYHPRGGLDAIPAFPLQLGPDLPRVKTSKF